MAGIPALLLVIPLLAIAGHALSCEPYNSTLVWTACGQLGHKKYKGVECAEFFVPLDWDDCSSQPLRLTATRVISKSSNPIGSLFIRFGGPGIATSPELEVIASTPVSEDILFGPLLERFHLTVLDVRGTGLNYPVQCDEALWNARFNVYPKNEEEYNATIEQYRRAGQSCLEKTGPVLGYMDALTDAKDMEAMRVALDEPLSIYALSWGTQFASQYAHLFPNNIRAMILDAIVDHSVSNVEIGQSESTTMALTVERALGWASTNKTSPLYGQDAVQIYRDIVKQAEETPFHSPECGKSGACDPNVTAQDILNSLETWTETPTDAVTFLEFAQVLKQTQKGNATGFARPYFTNQEAKTSSTPWTQAAIACQDWCPDTNWTAYQNWANMFTNNAIPAGGTFFGVVQIVCPHWPTPVRNPPRTIDIPNPSAPILVVNALWDPVTGYDQAVGMQRRIANSVLLTRNGEGHGSFYGPTYAPEAYQVMVDYLIDLKLPAPGTIVDKPWGTFRTSVNKDD